MRHAYVVQIGKGPKLSMVRFPIEKEGPRQVTLEDYADLRPSTDFVYSGTYGRVHGRASITLTPIEAVARFNLLVSQKISELRLTIASAEHKLARYQEIAHHATSITEAGGTVDFNLRNRPSGDRSDGFTTEDMARLDNEVFGRVPLCRGAEQYPLPQATPAEEPATAGLVLESSTELGVKDEAELHEA
jgi:hypothetical protein